MMKQCYNCKFWNNKENEFRNAYNDMISDETQDKFYCVMYSDSIPPKITSDKSKCKFYNSKKASD